MKLNRLLPGVAAASFLFALGAPAGAYCLTHTCDPKKGVAACEYQGNCNVGGKPLYWASSIVTWDVQKDGSTTSDLSSAQLADAATKAFGRWQAVDCGGGQPPSITLVNKGPIDCAKPEYNKAQPNANVITFHDSKWPYTNSAIETLALTTVFFNPDTGEIYDANVEVNTDTTTNTSLFRIGPTDYPNVDLNAVLTHELGHFLGLAHSEDPTATMYSSYEPGMDTLESDDIQGICASLPPGRMTTDTTEPRHGFSSECAQPEGCCASAIGGKAPPSKSLGLWAFGLGLCALLGRTRLRRAVRSAPALPR